MSEEPTIIDVMNGLHRLELKIVAIKTEFELVKKSVFGAISVAVLAVLGAIVSLVV